MISRDIYSVVLYYVLKKNISQKLFTSFQNNFSLAGLRLWVIVTLCDYNLFFTLKAIWIGDLVDTGGGLSMTTGTTTRKK